MNEEFIGQLKIGDHQASKDVYGLFYDRVFQATFFVIRDFDLAEDIVHDVFLKALDRNDLAFINTLNRILLGVGVLSVLLALLLGTAMSRHVSAPISRVTKRHS